MNPIKTNSIQLPVIPMIIHVQIPILFSTMVVICWSGKQLIQLVVQVDPITIMVVTRWTQCVGWINQQMDQSVYQIMLSLRLRENDEIWIISYDSYRRMLGNTAPRYSIETGDTAHKPIKSLSILIKTCQKSACSCPRGECKSVVYKS